MQRPDHLLEVAYIQYYHTMVTPIGTGVGLYVQPFQASVCEILPSHSFAGFIVSPYISFQPHGFRSGANCCSHSA